MGNNLQLKPHTLSSRQLLGKTAIGLMVWSMIALLLFLVVSFSGSLLTQAIQEQAAEFASSNPLLPLMLLFIGFIVTFIGNGIITGLYNLFYNQKYYDATKMFSLILLTNGLIGLFFAPLYLIFYNQTPVLFLILGMHILLSTFLSSNQIEFISNPNYSGSALLGNTLGLSISLLIYGLIYKASGSASIQQEIYLLLLFPPIIGFTITPFCLGIREKIYYKFYEMGSDSLYIASMDEVIQTQSATNPNNDEEEVNIDLS
jgi:hypothetical protein